MKVFANNNQTDETLVEQLLRGNKTAFELLYERYFDKLVWFCRQWVMDKSTAEDIVQEVFIVLIEQPERFDKNQKFSTWIYTVAINKCKNVLRNHSNQLRLLENEKFETETVQQNGMDSTKIKSELQRLLSTCSEKERLLFVLRFEYELPIKEIAGIAEVPEGTVKSGLFYLLKKVSQQLKSFTHES